MTRKKNRQIKALAAAIQRQIEWQHRMMELKHEARIKRMLKRQLLLRMNSKRSLPD